MDYIDKEKFDIFKDEDDLEFVVEDEKSESEKVFEEVSQENVKGQYDFISLISIAFIFLASAFMFIAITSSRRYGVEGNVFNLKRLFSGEYTKEIQTRYESTAPFPKEMQWLEDRISFIYGLGNKLSSGEKDDIQDEDINNPFVNPDKDHDEQLITTTTLGKQEETKAPKDTATLYKTTFRKQTTSETTTTEEETTEVTTTNNEAPDVKTTTTTTPQKQVTTTTTTTTKKQTTTTTTTNGNNESNDDSSDELGEDIL